MSNIGFPTFPANIFPCNRIAGLFIAIPRPGAVNCCSPGEMANLPGFLPFAPGFPVSGSRSQRPGDFLKCIYLYVQHFKVALQLIDNLAIAFLK